MPDEEVPTFPTFDLPPDYVATVATVLSPDPQAPWSAAELTEPEDRTVSILGVRITDVTVRRGMALIEQMIRQYDGRTGSVFFANAHTLNLACADPGYCEVLNSAEYVFGDGTGVRWAARLQGLRVRDNLAGTDFVPALLRATGGRGYRYFLLGTTPEVIRRAAERAAAAFPGWIQAGYHHGYVLKGRLSAQVVEQINAAAVDLLLVGMGNPLQEYWIHAHQRQLQVPVCMGVGGLFDHLGGAIRRAPAWLRRHGWEWLGLLLAQPHKARRYLLGNPLFLWRILREHRQRRRAGGG